MIMIMTEEQLRQVIDEKSKENGDTLTPEQIENMVEWAEILGFIDN